MIPEKVSTAFVDWQKRLVLARGESDEETAEQATLARVIDAGADHLYDYLLENLLMSRSDTPDMYGVQLLHRQLSEGEANDPPKELELEIADAFADLHPAQAIRPTYWTVAHAQWLKLELLGDDWVRGLKGKNNDATARNVCRKLGGLHHIRGKVSVLSDCPISRAWWRVRIAKQAAEASEGRLNVENAYSALRRNTSWAELIGGCVRNVAVINEPRALAAICTNIHNNFRIAPPKNYARDIARGLARHSNVLSLHVTPFKELLRICEEASIDFYAQAVESDEAEQDDEVNRGEDGGVGEAAEVL